MIKNLILSSGGVNGYFFVGALKYLLEQNLLSNLENILGTSAGSVFGLLYLLGFSIDEIIELVTKMEPSNLLNINAENILTFLDDYGLDDGEKIIKIIRIVCKRKHNIVKLTFQDLFNISNITFTVAALNINTKKMLYFSHKNYPNMEVGEAIRMSSSIPILFKPVLFEGNYVVDGGALDPCSLDYFKNPKETLGLMISIRKEKQINDLRDFMIQLFCSPLDKIVDSYYDRPNIIIFDTSDSEGMNFLINTTEIKELINLGYNITKDEITDILDYFRHTSD